MPALCPWTCNTYSYNGCTGKGADYGVLIKSGTALKLLIKIQTVVFDKTGTITEGKPKVTDIIACDKDISEDYLLGIAASGEKKFRASLRRSKCKGSRTKKGLNWKR